MSAQSVILSVAFQARPGKEAELKEALAALLAPTRAEEGCIFYDLHVAADDPAKLLFYESWASKEHHAAHDRTPHVLALLAHLDKLSFPPVKTCWEKVD